MLKVEVILFGLSWLVWCLHYRGTLKDPELLTYIRESTVISGHGCSTGSRCTTVSPYSTATTLNSICPTINIIAMINRQYSQFELNVFHGLVSHVLEFGAHTIEAL